MWAIGLLAAIALPLAGCESFGPGMDKPVAAPTTPQPEQPQVNTAWRTPAMLPPGAGAQIPGAQPGAEPIRIGLLLPTTSRSADARRIAEGLQDAAQMAVFDSGNPNLLLLPRDTRGTAEGAIEAARGAIADGAEIIVGPLFSQEVTAIAPVTTAAGIPVIAFSSDRSAGQFGVFLLSFQPESEVERVLAYAATQGRMNVAALVPGSAYGVRVETALRESAPGNGQTVVSVQQFDTAPEQAAAAAAAAVAALPQGFDSVLIADGGAVLKAATPALSARGMPKLLGTGLWDDPALSRDVALTGGWFPAPADNGRSTFAARYESTFGGAPPRIAGLAYDAITLVNALSRGAPYARFHPDLLSNPNGFSGLDGAFRFRPDGAIERGLAVYEVTPAGPRIVSPAPRSFVPGS